MSDASTFVAFVTSVSGAPGSIAASNVCGGEGEMLAPGQAPSVAANVVDVLPKARIRLGTDPSAGASRDASSDVGLAAGETVVDGSGPALGVVSVSRLNTPEAKANATPNTANAT